MIIKITTPRFHNDSISFESYLEEIFGSYILHPETYLFIKGRGIFPTQMYELHFTAGNGPGEISFEQVSRIKDVVLSIFRDAVTEVHIACT